VVPHHVVHDACDMKPKVAGLFLKEIDSVLIAL